MSSNYLNHCWDMVRFGDVVRNASLVERDPIKAGIDRIVGLEHIDSNSLHICRWNRPNVGTSFTRKFVPGQTLFGKRRTYQRKVAFAEFEGICSGDILTFESKDPDILLPKLLPFLCQTDVFFDYALSTSAGSLSPRTSWSALKNFELPLPPLDAQKRIAEILWIIDETIEVFSTVSKALGDLEKSFLNYVFQTRDHFSNEGLQFSNYAIGDICNVRRGASPRPINDAIWFSDSGPGWVRISDVTKASKYLETTEQKLSADGVARSVYVRAGEVIMSICATIGLPIIAGIDACIHDGFVVFKEPSEQLNEEYLYYFLKSATERFSRKAQPGTQKNLNTSIVKGALIPLPSRCVQKDICQMFKQIENKKVVLNTYQASLTDIKTVVLNGSIGGDRV